MTDKQAVERLSEAELDALENTALAASEITPGPWSVTPNQPEGTYVTFNAKAAWLERTDLQLSETEWLATGDGREHNNHIAAFDPPTVLRLIAQARSSEGAEPDRWKYLEPHEQEALATKIAANIGYRLVSDLSPQPQGDLAAIRAGTLSKNGASVTLDFDCGVDADAAYEVLVGLLSAAPKAPVEDAPPAKREWNGMEIAQQGEVKTVLLSAAVKGEVKADIAADREWINGARYGWNCAEAGDRQRLDDAIEGRRREIKAAALSTPSPVSVEEIAASLKRLTLMARTSGGTAGPDAGLMDACGDAETILARLSPAQEGAE